MNLLANSLLEPKDDLRQLFRLYLNLRQLCDIELIMNQGFSPLTGFMTQQDYEKCLHHLTLTDGTVWPMPITLDIEPSIAQQLKLGQRIVLANKEGTPVAFMKVESIWQPDKKIEAECIFRTTDTTHPGVHYLMNHSQAYYVGGSLEALTPIQHFDFTHLRHTPAQLKHYFSIQAWKCVVGFQTRNPMHRAHFELTLQAQKQTKGHLLIHPVVGSTKPGDVDYITRVRCYEKLISYYPKGRARLSLLPLAMRMAGPREALWHAIIRKNYGCTHFIVGRDHAGPGSDRNGKLFYEPYEAQLLVNRYADKVGIEVLTFKEMVYLKNTESFLPIDQVKDTDEPMFLSGTEFRRRLDTRELIPEWFSFPAVIKELQQAYPPKESRGIVLLLTGLSGAGKSTIAKALMAKLQSDTGRTITLLDGDIVRTFLSSELGFSKAHRDLNIQRIGFVAMEIAKHGGTAICAPIAPYHKSRQAVKELAHEYGVAYYEIYISTPLSVCEQRDPKGLYSKARSQLIKGFTGIDDPYEAPVSPTLTLDTSQLSLQQCVDIIFNSLHNDGYIPINAD